MVRFPRRAAPRREESWGAKYCSGACNNEREELVPFESDVRATGGDEESARAAVKAPLETGSGTPTMTLESTSPASFPFFRHRWTLISAKKSASSLRSP
ncbi:hypothetical protein GUJ93_ZPchr0006g43777 [Zizania palustris]|uniref:Uncharacterized protein n=1 Tax=Zizania palustris TaxID=103762 RepID=A0A8J5W3Y0_ZIZPA|nr:hypothetical protein GUJ93_ZPchr0006g43777 [Zizania palustris]